MYESFYGFKEKPFSMLPDPGFLFLSKKHQAALTLLEYGLLNHVGFCVISGEPGAGKTTILRAMLERIDEDTTVGMITNTHQSFGGLLDWILSVFDLHRAELTHVEMHQIFMEFLIEEYANNRSVLLIVDEAQNMNADSLEELRMLSNVNSEKDQLLQVVLSGQPALKDMLRRPELMQFAQRIAVDYHLDPLSLVETCGYIQHRLVTAGAEYDVFTPAACERIYNYSGGTPRLINLLCETVLVYGFADQRQMIGVDLVDEMVQERMKDSVVPIVNRDIARQVNRDESKGLEENFPWIRIRPETGEPAVDAPAAEASAEATEESETMNLQEAAEYPVVDSATDSTTDSDVESSVADSQTVESQPAPVKIIAADEKIPGQASARSTESEHNSDEVEPEPADTEVESASQEPEQVAKTVPEPASAQLSGAEALSNATAGITGKTISLDGTLAGDGTRNQLIKYGVIAVVVGLVLIVSAVLLKDSGESRPDVALDEPLSQQKLEEQDKVQLQAEVEEFKRQREAAILKSAEDARVEAAEKLAAEESARMEVAAKLAVEKERAEKEKLKKEQLKKEQLKKEQAAAVSATRKQQLRAEKKRKAREKEREARYAAAREKRKATRLADEKRLIEQEEAQRLEQEWIEREQQMQTKKP